VTVGFSEKVVATGVGTEVLRMTIVVETTAGTIAVAAAAGICMEGVAAVTMIVTKTEAVWGIADIFVAKVVMRRRRGEGVRRIVVWRGRNEVYLDTLQFNSRALFAL